MKAVGFHNNIVSLIGCCTISSPCFLIVEFASNGDLLSYLRQYRKKVFKTAVSESKVCLKKTVCVGVGGGVGAGGGRGRLALLTSDYKNFYFPWKDPLGRDASRSPSIFIVGLASEQLVVTGLFT